MVNFATANGSVVDLGGQWGGASHHRFAALTDELSLTRFPSYYQGLGVFHWQGERRQAPLAKSFADSLLFFDPKALGLAAAQLAASSKLQAAFGQLVAQVNHRQPWLSADSERLDRLSVSAWVAEQTTEPLAKLPLAWLCRVGGSGGFEPWETSILHLAWTQAVAPQNESPEAWLIRGSAGSVAKRLAVDLITHDSHCLLLGNAAQRISQSGEGVSVETSDGSMHQARLGIVAVPPPQRLAIQFDPPLPAAHTSLLQRSPMGGMTKILAIYELSFWREQGFSGLGIGDRPALQLTADSGPPEGQPAVLTSFVAGESAIKLNALTAAERRALILEDLAAYWGPQAATPLELVEQPWNAEPWTGGAFTSFVAPGCWTSHARFAAAADGGPAPANHGRVLWAGSEVSPRWPGYFEGAIEAAERAAASAETVLQGE
jgi:monoamine oxidase